MRVIGLDVHRSFAVSAILEGGQLREGERVVLEYEKVVAFAKTLRPDDEVVLEATGNTAAVARLIAPHVQGGHRLGRQAALDQPGRGRSLHDNPGANRVPSTLSPSFIIQSFYSKL